MKLPLHWIDAFTDRVFSGNPAAVVPLDAWLPDAVMQQIAFENGISETAFVVRRTPDRFHLRWFTPTIEVDLCGHATLATAHVLFTEPTQTGERIVFDSRSGPLNVTRRGDLLELDFPSRPADELLPLADAPRALLAGLRAAPREIRKVSNAAHFLAIYDHAADVRALRPDFSLLASLGDLRVIATAPGDDCDFVSRFFAPGAGVPEDPVTGSSHCTLIPYWAAQLGKTSLHARQISARGGELHCELKDERVSIAGRCVCYLRGEISI